MQANPSASHSPLTRLHREFFPLGVDDPQTVWTRAASSRGVIEYLTLCDNLDAATRIGTRTRLSRWSAGAAIDQAVVHDFFEEVLLLRGSLEVGREGSWQGLDGFEPFTYACRPPGIWHGPFHAPQGCLMLEFYYFA
jgi:hypothetical protein